VSLPRHHAGALRGVLVGAVSALLTAVAHAAAGGTPLGTPLLLLVIACATVGTATSALAIEHRRAEIVILVGALGAAQVVGHVILAGAEHHGTHSVVPSMPMLAAHAATTVVLAVLISLAEFLYQVCQSVLCWLRLVAIHRSRAVGSVLRDTTETPVRRVLLRSGMGMRAPPVRTALGV
jgi:hypothetical protein